MSANPKEFPRHSQTKDRYTCEFCGKHFAFKSILLAHKTAHGVVTAKFPKCRQLIPRKRDFAKPHGCFKCKVCGETFDRKDAMMESTRRDSGEIVYKCRICHAKRSSNSHKKNRNFVKKEELDEVECEEELITNLEIKPEQAAYNCSKCSKNFTNSYLLNFHVKICSKLQVESVERVKTAPVLRLSSKRIIACQYCNNEFATNNQLVSHIKSCSELRSDTTFICQYCGEEFPIKAHLLAHMKTHKFYVCGVCDKSFAQKCHLLKHLEVFAGVAVKCGTCKGMFLHGEELSGHLASHRQEEQGVCDVCRRVFWVDELREHYKAHMVYKCELCELKFSKSSLLMLHMTLHTGEKSFECEVCDERFLNVDLLKGHIGVHAGEFECNVCRKICMDNVSFARYVLKK